MPFQTLSKSIITVKKGKVSVIITIFIMPQCALMCLNKQDFEYTTGLKYVKQGSN